MCLSLPGRVIEILDDAPFARLARVDFGGTLRETNLSLVPEAGVGDYVLVHVGFALSRLDPEEARRTFEALEQAGYVEPAAGSDTDS